MTWRVLLDAGWFGRRESHGVTPRCVTDRIGVPHGDAMARAVAGTLPAGCHRRVVLWATAGAVSGRSRQPCSTMSGVLGTVLRWGGLA